VAVVADHVRRDLEKPGAGQEGVEEHREHEDEDPGDRGPEAVRADDAEDVGDEPSDRERHSHMNQGPPHVGRTAVGKADDEPEGQQRSSYTERKQEVRERHRSPVFNGYRTAVGTA